MIKHFFMDIQKINNGFLVSRLVIFEDNRKSIEEQRHTGAFEEALLILRGWSDEATNLNTEVEKV